ncbi:DUF2628 domain-containing protein [Mycobacterium branderi]|uniref:DUF2628 domain-containing protein n=1 Tax=Mycobacterium branderi TaxID=43348 RepID=A0A7I7WEC4_9MYCO|nr:DUF2628 domain-containing protein [Mycobacterium branderi]MCV7236282.1 DUF2628 domain-containing protein [Mycobacterium branderi]ORA35456.1 hypothetical protein BST20_17855 [Mycobacterium branderi]BBZ15165.1 hypothetical protein MBRA_53600 [Mycobacterium branderi]
MPESYDINDVPQRWQQRFAFFDAYGLPSSSPAAREAYKALPFGARFRLTGNFPAFLFGPFYFMAKGMWRKGITLLAAAIALAAAMVVLPVPDSIARPVGVAFAVAVMLTANYAYYLHVVKRSRSWNPLEGWSGRRARTDS